MEKSGTRIAVFNNDSENEKAPALKGFIEVNGQKVKDVALWANRNGNGFNGTISEPYKTNEGVAKVAPAKDTPAPAQAGVTSDLPF